MSECNSTAAGIETRILVVDDDAGIRLLISHHLKKNGYQTITAAGVGEAKACFDRDPEERFAAVVTDYLMPDGTGLELLEWIKNKDKALAAIFVTGVGERDLVKRSLRTGACDFLDKPVQIQPLLQAVSEAVDRTRRQRALEEAESSVQEVGKLQQFMLGSNPAGLPGIIDICWHPKHAAGGDLVNVFNIGPNRLLVVVADVSGHDLKAGFISAFFQGVVRGMVEKQTPINEVFHYFNEFLAREWNGNSSGGARSNYDVSASVSACAFDIDLKRGTFSVWNSGFPVPIHTNRRGQTRRCGESAGHPLGWFEDSSPSLFEQQTESGCFVYAWTDGLEDLAGQLGISPLSVAESLLSAKQNNVQPAFLKHCGDDVLVVRLNLAPEEETIERFVPVLYEEYFASHGQRIDELQSQWERSIQTALPSIPESKLFDLLLCSREAVINGIKYGCAANPKDPCSYEIAFQPGTAVLRVSVNDPGPGHDFDWDGYAKAAEEQLLDAHRGLLLMNRLPARTTFARHGASVTMEFELSQPLQP